MSLLNENIQKQVRQVFDNLTEPVKLVLFTQQAGGAIECTMCSETRQLAEEVSELSDKISLEVLDFVADKQAADQYQVDKIPAIVVLKDGQQPKDHGVRLFGIPSGYEFSTFIEDILMMSKGKAELKKKTVQELEKLDRPVHIQVFVTPT
jgi:glutaredoxin-like protein